EPEPIEGSIAGALGAEGAEEFEVEDEGGDHAAEGYIDMGETWGYTDDGKLRTVRDEVEIPPAGIEGETEIERPTTRKRAKGSGKRGAAAPSEKRGSGRSSSREHKKGRGSRT